MKPGDKVIIYQRPITKEDPEGTATLVEQIGEDVGDGLTLWVVCFPRERATYVRTIYTEEQYER
jgi:hypothetical protein